MEKTFLRPETNGGGYVEDEEQEQEFDFLNDDGLKCNKRGKKADNRQASGALRCHLVPFSAFGKAKGKGKGFGKKAKPNARLTVARCASSNALPSFVS